ncbi:hypothetical protein [Roseobacter sp.]|uniref:hypothetical protein n=1 Tax=Roseobacter sp. TaxID=1907202 RepID=UPI00385AE4ED
MQNHLNRNGVAPFRSIAAALTCLALSFATGTAALAQEKENISVLWEMTETDAERVASKLDFEGEIQPVEGEAVRGAPLVVLVGVAVLPSLVDAVITFYRDLTQGGVIIDASGEQIAIETSTGLPYGTILVRDANGIEIQNFRSTPKPADLSSAIVEAAKAAAIK